MATPDQPSPFALPAAILSQGYALRSESDNDIPFLMQVYTSTRDAELSLVPWSPEQKQAFIAHQFQAQRQHYRTAITGCMFQIIERNGAAIGRLYLQPRATRFYIVDISLMPDYCGRGIGTAILRALQTTASESGLGVGIMVEKFNPALRLYRRLGFIEVADHSVYLEMEWMPFVPQTNADAVSRTSPDS